MGTSTDAHVFYGYCWHGGDQDFSTDMDEVVGSILAADGHTNPWDVHYHGDYAAWRAWADGEGREELEAYRALEEAVEDGLGVRWGSHCSGECPMPYLYVPGTRIVAWRGDPKPLSSLAVDEAWKGRLDAFLESQGIEPPGGVDQPGWWVASRRD
jgi:hypothetical protein